MLICLSRYYFSPFQFVFAIYSSFFFFFCELRSRRVLESSLFNIAPPPPYFFVCVWGSSRSWDGFPREGFCNYYTHTHCAFTGSPFLTLPYDSLYCLLFTHLSRGQVLLRLFSLSLSRVFFFFFLDISSRLVSSRWRAFYVLCLLAPALLCSTLLGIGALIFFFPCFFIYIFVGR